MESRLSVPDLSPRLRVARARTGLATLCGLVVGLWAVTAMAAPPKPKKKAARQHFDRAVELYSAEDFDGAAEQARLGYEIEPHESLLFIQAQAERKRGNCIDAVGLLDKFINSTNSESMRDNALTAKALCAEELAAQAREAEAERKRLEEEAAAAEAAAQQEQQPPPPTPAEPPPRRWYRDPVGGVLVGVGGVALLAGSGVLIASSVLRPERAGDYQAFSDRKRQHPQLVVAGFATAGAGAALAIAGGVRWALLARKEKAAGSADTMSRVMISPWLSGPGLTVQGRF